MEDDDDIPVLVDETDPVSTAESSQIAKTEYPSLAQDGEDSDPVPVTIITGLLGSGKTTLVSRLLTSKTHNKRIAFILNEFGDSVGIDKALTVSEAGQESQEWLELANGCMCCEVKDAGVKAIESLMTKRGKFDYILIETTGLADPGPIAELFWLDTPLQAQIYLDAIITVIDALHFPSDSAAASPTRNESLRQLAMADRIVLSKTDLVSPQSIEDVEVSLREVNASAPVVKAVKGDVPIDFLFEVHAYDGNDRGLRFAGLNDQLSCEDPACSENHATHTHSVVPKHRIDSSITTIAFTLPATARPIPLPRLESWLQSFLWTRALPPDPNPIDPQPTILRLKALLQTASAEDKKRRTVVQAVHELYDTFDAGEWNEEVAKVVVVGVGLELDSIRNSFLKWCTENST